MHMTECTESTQPPRTTPPLRRTTPRTTVEWVGGRAGGRATYSTFGLLALRLSKAITKR